MNGEALPTILPYLTVRDARAELHFCHEVFGGKTLKILESDDGSVAHARTQIGKGIVMLYEEASGIIPGNGAPGPDGTSPVAIRIEISQPETVDQVFQRALQHGAQPVIEPTERPW
ncbi:MAG: VOC family protein, partial [Pseudomonadota bacterium]